MASKPECCFVLLDQHREIVMVFDGPGVSSNLPPVPARLVFCHHTASPPSIEGSLCRFEIRAWSRSCRLDFHANISRAFGAFRPRKDAQFNGSAPCLTQRCIIHGSSSRAMLCKQSCLHKQQGYGQWCGHMLSHSSSYSIWRCSVGCEGKVGWQEGTISGRVRCKECDDNQDS